MAQVLSSNNQEANFFLDLNNDISRILSLLDKDENIRKLLYYIESDALLKEPVKISLVDKTICRVPLVPLENKTKKDAGYLMVNLLVADEDDKSNVVMAELAIDILVPMEQWIINEGLRPLVIGKYVNDVMRYKLSQTSGIKYRLVQIINIKLSDRLTGFRLIYATGIDD